MHCLKNLGLTLLITAFVFPVGAEDSSLADRAAGLATDIVETNNVIHVYRYLGASPEAGLSSTFDEGETWFDQAPLNALEVVPSQVAPSFADNPYRYSRRGNTVAEPSDYVERIDTCREAGDRWDYRTETCQEAFQ